MCEWRLEDWGGGLEGIASPSATVLTCEVKDADTVVAGE